MAHENNTSSPETFHVSGLDEWRKALQSTDRRPLLTHLNADTTWLIQIPLPTRIPRPQERTHFNILIDPWLQGPQSDVASWFSTQWHVVASSVDTLAKLNGILYQLEKLDRDQETSSDDISNMIDVVVVSHEFTDHCHQATLQELPKGTPVIATDIASNLIQSWGHFDTVITAPGLEKDAPWTSLKNVCSCLPEWLAIGRVVTPGNSLYYHSAIFIAFDLCEDGEQQNGLGEAIIYSPHGISGEDLAFVPSSGMETLALLHGLHDVSIWMTKQLNLGALNGIRAVEASRAKYWIATHDEIKRGGGFIAPLLRRVQYTPQQAIEYERKRLQDECKLPTYIFKELGSGDGIILR
ncbi:unnamed protein product [Clonostachys rosea]|uniref:Metallo-beta-lactamase domain-containing protein n=1 Tax=Bionectria ochroleuca TaxID=29856 RepID=A0ABY6TPV6_BIOOC|nr:unnamed protein product [Clonostachys rosea]